MDGLDVFSQCSTSLTVEHAFHEPVAIELANEATLPPGAILGLRHKGVFLLAQLLPDLRSRPPDACLLRLVALVELVRAAISRYRPRLIHLLQLLHPAGLQRLLGGFKWAEPLHELRLRQVARNGTGFDRPPLLVQHDEPVAPLPQGKPVSA